MAQGILDPLYETFLGRTNDALNQPDAPWQAELMETVNPQKVRAQNIKRALAEASMKLATTPGNFLTGLSAAAGTGANSYLAAQDQAEQDRMKAMQLVQAAQQKGEDRRLALLMDAIGVKRNLHNDQIAEEDRQYRRGRDAKSDERQAKLDDSLIDYRTRSRSGGSSSSGADAAVERRRGKAADTYFRQLDKLREDNYGEEPSEEDKDALWNEIMRRYRVDGDGSDAPPDEGSVPTSDASTVQQPSQVSPTASGAIVANAPPPLEQRIVGKVYATQKGNFMWTGQGWKPVL